MEINLQENPWVGWLALAVLVALALVGLAFLGQSVTPADAPRALHWSDWQVLQARRARAEEAAVLRADLQAIALALHFPPDPVSAQLLQTRVRQHTRSGQPTLQLARAAVQNAADGLAAWASGILERDALVGLIQQAEAALR